MKSCALGIILLLLITDQLQLALGDSVNCPWHDLVAPEGIFQIRVNGSRPVLCDGQGWMDILSRGDGSENFDRNWTDYKEGFGKLWGEFFLGLEKLHQLTKDEPHLLYVYLRDVHSNSRFARYDGFQIGSEEESYSLKALGRYSGSAGDSLGIHRGMKFSTIDRDNTRSKANCAEIYGGGWWYNDCGDSDLTGKYFNIGKTDLNGILWKTWRKHVFPLSITKVTMSIVSKSQNDQIEREWQSYDRTL